MLCIANKICDAPLKPPTGTAIFGTMDNFSVKIKKTLWKSYFDFFTCSAMM